MPANVKSRWIKNKLPIEGVEPPTTYCTVLPVALHSIRAEGFEPAFVRCIKSAVLYH